MFLLNLTSNLTSERLIISHYHYLCNIVGMSATSGYFKLSINYEAKHSDIIIQSSILRKRTNQMFCKWDLDLYIIKHHHNKCDLAPISHPISKTLIMALDRHQKRSKEDIKKESNRPKRPRRLTRERFARRCYSLMNKGFPLLLCVNMISIVPLL